MEHLKAIGTLFYVIDPKETMFEKVSDIPKPDFTTRVIKKFLFQEKYQNFYSKTKKFTRQCHISFCLW